MKTVQIVAFQSCFFYFSPPCICVFLRVCLSVSVCLDTKSVLVVSVSLSGSESDYVCVCVCVFVCVSVCMYVSVRRFVLKSSSKKAAAFCYNLCLVVMRAQVC